MSLPRPHPFPLLFGGLVEAHFPAIHAVVGAEPSLDQFLLVEPALTLLQALRPDEAERLDGGTDFALLGYAAYRYWEAGQQGRGFDDQATRALCAGGASGTTEGAVPRYIQVAPRLIWASLDGGIHHEPLDGWFCVPGPDTILVVALFGVHPERPGVSALAVEGAPTALVERPDGSAPFAPTMDGGAAAGLLALATEAEILTLAWRALAMEQR